MDYSDKSAKYIKANVQLLIDSFVNPEIHKPSSNPVAFFMAGSPGVGKTEFSKSFIDVHKQRIPDVEIARIDADEIREKIPYYDGHNSDLVQRGAVLGVQKLFDHVIKKKINFLLDGTFVNYKLEEENITRCLNHGFKVAIFYIYQEPEVAWEFTKKREAMEGRTIPKEAFVKAFFASRDNINLAKEEFKKKITIFLIIKNFENKVEKVHINIDKIDSFLKNKYNPKSLVKLLR